jgi:serralysin
MLGGAGDDTYIVDDAGDRVLETAGTDTILLRTASISLPGVSVENVIGDQAGIAFNIVGNAIATLLVGGDGNDTIFAYQNNDTINGLGGDDIIDGGSEHDSILGGDGRDTLSGNTGNDTILGGAGNDSLIGGSGGDEFIFDSALGTTNVDRISSYSVTDDAIRLDDAVFVGIGAAGTLAASAFTTGAVATSTDHRIIYNSATGALFYDADGSGTGAAVQFATLTGVSGVITNTEFLII